MTRGSNAWIVVGSLLYFLASYFGATPLSLHNANIVQLNIASGIGMIMCLHGGIKALFILALAAPLSHSLAIFHWDPNAALFPAILSGLLAPVACFLSAKAWDKHFSYEGLRFETLLPYLIRVCLLPGLLLGSLTSMDSLYGGYTGQGGYFYDLYEITSAYALGILLVAPLYYIWTHTSNPVAHLTQANVLYILGYLMLTLGAFVLSPGLIFIAPVVPIILAFKGEELAALLGLFGMGIIVAAIAPYGLGPFDLPDKVEGHMALLTFVLVSMITPIAIGLHARRLQSVSKSRDRWQTKAQTDQLTGLPNRYAFFPELERSCEGAKNADETLVVAVLDVDHFKMVNDSYGHATGDKVLAQIAELIRDQMRESDVVARIGGEEFAILLHGPTVSQAKRALDRLRQRCESHQMTLPDGSLSVTVSIGAVVYQRSESKEDVMARADAQLYKAKREGRNRVIIE
ncbi:GGDEF domain-containing protein [Enterovibrio sp. ZSDZ35]|uniref:diguanylate cyclase n=1 Tax=Enterovibrio qingdaonensis TaxID=2899818 RepID=A0ABT5QGL3_9GAMM|nr:diguanylate cyclase [Enterovibrio sp. ZSDZ35]MDD1780111.1 GGDEF domain-containing protein [Enterovibrio sp. ZSDZ35]